MADFPRKAQYGFRCSFFSSEGQRPQRRRKQTAPTLLQFILFPIALQNQIAVNGNEYPVAVEGRQPQFRLDRQDFHAESVSVSFINRGCDHRVSLIKRIALFHDAGLSNLCFVIYGVVEKFQSFLLI